LNQLFKITKNLDMKKIQIGTSAGILEQSMGGYEPSRKRVVVPVRQGCIGCMAGRYDNSVPTGFLASIDCSKIPAQFLLPTLRRKSLHMSLQIKRRGKILIPTIERTKCTFSVRKS
jgi:hypothetical protein